MTLWKRRSPSSVLKLSRKSIRYLALDAILESQVDCSHSKTIGHRVIWCLPFCWFVVRSSPNACRWCGLPNQSRYTALVTLAYIYADLPDSLMKPIWLSSSSLATSNTRYPLDELQQQRCTDKNDVTTKMRAVNWQTHLWALHFFLIPFLGFNQGYADFYISFCIGVICESLIYAQNAIFSGQKIAGFSYSWPSAQNLYTAHDCPYSFTFFCQEEPTIEMKPWSQSIKIKQKGVGIN